MLYLWHICIASHVAIIFFIFICMQVDILHPLATLHWEECCKIPQGTNHPQCVSLNDKVYVGVGLAEGSESNKLYISSTELKSWSTLNTPTYKYALTTYHSQLVLVGGKEISTDQVTNKLWTLSASLDWQPSLPPMPTARYSPTAVTIATPECLVVAGGAVGNEEYVDTVEVFSQEQWTTVQPLPIKCRHMKSTLRNGKLYFLGGYPQEYTVCYSNVTSLTDFSQTDVKKPMQLWDQFEVPLRYTGAALFGQQLIMIAGYDSEKSFFSKIIAHSPHSQHCVHVGDIPMKLDCVSAVVFPTGDLLVIGGWGAQGYSDRVFKATLRGEEN